MCLPCSQGRLFLCPNQLVRGIFIWYTLRLLLVSLWDKQPGVEYFEHSVGSAVLFGEVAEVLYGAIHFDQFIIVQRRIAHLLARQ